MRRNGLSRWVVTAAVVVSSWVPLGCTQADIFRKALVPQLVGGLNRVSDDLLADSGEEGPNMMLDGLWNAIQQVLVPEG